MAKPEDLLGTWTMLSWRQQTVATGQIVDAHGPDPVGYITYGADGRMHAIVVRRDRAVPRKLPATDAEKLRLFDSMLAYAGTYSLDEDKVVHHVDASGSAGKCLFEVGDDDLLHLHHGLHGAIGLFAIGIA